MLTFPSIKSHSLIILTTTTPRIRSYRPKFTDPIFFIKANFFIFKSARPT